MQRARGREGHLSSWKRTSVIRRDFTKWQ